MRKSLAIVLACCAIALAMGLAACGGSSSAGASASASGSAEASSPANASKESYVNMPVGKTAKMDNGEEVTVNEVEEFVIDERKAEELGLPDIYHGHTWTRVNVTYVNNSDGEEGCNSFDWAAKDSDGTERPPAMWSDDGYEIEAGETKTIDVYFEYTGLKEIRYDNFNLPKGDYHASWVVSN